MFLFLGTYNIALKGVKAILEGEKARTEAETDYDQPRKRKRNRKYESSSEDEEFTNAVLKTPRGTSTEIPAPNPLPNKLKALFKSKAAKTAAQRQQKETSVGKIFACNKSSFKSSNVSQLACDNAMLSYSSDEQRSSLNDGKYLLDIIILYIHYRMRIILFFFSDCNKLKIVLSFKRARRMLVFSEHWIYEYTNI